MKSAGMKPRKHRIESYDLYFARCTGGTTPSSCGAIEEELDCYRSFWHSDGTRHQYFLCLRCGHRFMVRMQ